MREEGKELKKETEAKAEEARGKLDTAVCLIPF